MPKPDKYDDTTNDIFNIFDTANSREFKWNWVKKTLKSAFPPPAEDARQLAREVYDNYGHNKNDAEERIERFAESRVEPWREALSLALDFIDRWPVELTIEEIARCEQLRELLSAADAQEATK